MRPSFRTYVLISVGIAVVALTAAIALYTFVGPEQRKTVQTEAIKTLLQLVLVGLIGGFVTWLLSESAKERERQSREHERIQERAAREREKESDHLRELNRFRRDVITRLVTNTNVVRRAPLLIASHRSKKTYGDQMREILAARMDLSVVRHELRAAETTIADVVADSIADMERYLERIVAEWRDSYSSLPDPPADAWAELQQLPRLEDLRRGDKTTDFYRYYLLEYQRALTSLRREILAGNAEGPTVTERVTADLATLAGESRGRGSRADDTVPTAATEARHRGTSAQR